MDKIKNTIILALVLIFIFFITFQPPLDLDLGWHLKYGEYFFKTGSVLMTNIHSFVWPGYRWVEASWGYDLLIYQLFTHFGFVGISILGSLISLIIFLLVISPLNPLSLKSPRSPLFFFFLSLIFLTQTVPLYLASVRAQSVSALFFAVFLVLLRKLADGKKSGYFLPLLFLIWANFHGGFSLGIIISVIIFLVSILLDRKLAKIFTAILVISILATFINPFSIRLFQEVFLHASNTNLSFVGEWTPLYNVFPENIILVVVTLFTTFVFLKKKKAAGLPWIFAYFVVTALAMGALRFSINFGIFTTFLIAQALTKLRIRQLDNQIMRAIVWIILITATVSDYFVFKKYLAPAPTSVLTFNWQKYCETLGTCSTKITDVIIKYPPTGNGYHPYNMGGYLIWAAPQIKTFIDGRMVGWEKDKETVPLFQGDAVFVEKNPIIWRALDAKYHFQWAIVPVKASITHYLDNLVKSGLWTLKYKDNLYWYYVKR